MKQKLIRTGINAATCMFLLVMFFISFNCIESPLEPVAPSSDVQLSVPLVDKTNLFGDFVKDTTYRINSDSTISYVTVHSTTPRQIDTLIVQPEFTEEKVELGRFGLMGFNAPTRTFNASEIGIPHGNSSLPAGDFTLAAVTMNATSQFDFIAAYSGRIILTIKNNLPVSIDFPSGIVLKNNWTSPTDTGTIADFFIGSLNPGETLPIPRDLPVGTLLRGLLSTNPIAIHTVGSSVPVTIDTSSAISISFQFQSLVADSAFAVIPSQQVSKEKPAFFTVDDSVVIQTAWFRSGKFSVAVKSNIDLETESEVKIQEIFKTKSNTSFSLIQPLASRDSLTTSVSVDTLYISDASGSSLGTRMHYSIGIRVINSLGLKKYVSQYDVVSVRLIPQGKLVVREMTGKIPPQLRDINSGEKSQFALGDVKDKASAVLLLKDTKTIVHLSFTGGTPFEYSNLQLIAVNSKYRQTASMMIPVRRINPTQGDTPIDLSGMPNYENFINFFGSHFPDLPDSFYVRGQLLISPRDVFESSTYYTVYDTSKVYPSFDLDIPSAMSITNGHIRETQPIEGKIPKEFLRAVKNGTISFVFTNRIPFVLTSSISFLGVDTSTHRRDTLVSFNSLGPIASAHVGANSFSDSSAVSNIKIYLAEDQIQKVNQADSLVIRYDLATGNNGAIVKIRNTDAIRVQGSVNIRYTINKP